MTNVVLVGDTGGYVTAYEKRTGRPVNYGGYPLKLTDIPYREGDQGERWWEPIGGTATQMTVAHGLMLVGVNSRLEEETVLKAFRLFPLPDLYLRLLEAPPTAGPDGFQLRVQPACAGCETEIETTLQITVGGRTVVRPVRFGPGIVPEAITLQSGAVVPGTSVPIVATVDPDDLVAESNELNNTLRATVLIADTVCCESPASRWGSKLTD
jgi:hypothetical protein